MEKANVFVTRSDYPPSGLQSLTSKFKVEFWPSERGRIPRSILLEKIRGREALYISVHEQVNDELLDAAGPNLKVISTWSVGLDHIDLNAVKKRGVRIGYTPNVLTEAVAELTIGLLLATSRRFFEAHKEILNGGWSSTNPLWMCGPALKSSTVGIVGLGRIGLSVARKLLSFAVGKICYWGRSPRPEGSEIGAIFMGLDDLLRESDFVIVACAMTPETKNLFTAEKFGMMKKSAIFINVARGGIVDQEALVQALKDGTIGAAGLDVMTPEPLPPDHELLTLPNCVIIPHIGSANHQTRIAMTQLASNNVIAALEGRPMPAEMVL